MHTQQRHRRSRRHDTQTGKRNYPPHPPPHAREIVRNRTRRSSRYTTSNHALQAEASPMHANSPPRIPVHLRCTQYNQRREPTRYARSHVITQCHHGMHAMHSRTHTRACPCISDAHRTNNSANQTDGTTKHLSRPNKLHAPTYIAYVR